MQTVAVSLGPFELLLASLAVSALYVLAGLVVAAATGGRRRAAAERLTRTAGLPALVGAGTFAYVVTVPPEAGDLPFLLGTLAVGLAAVAAPVLAVTLAPDSDAVDAE